MRFLLLFTWVSWSAVAQTAPGFDPLTSPNMSVRCRDLLKERNEKIQVRQKLSSLVQRNDALLKKVAPNRVSMRRRLEANGITLRNEHYLAALQVQNMEEGIVRSGCPGISL